MSVLLGYDLIDYQAGAATVQRFAKAGAGDVFAVFADTPTLINIKLAGAKSISVLTLATASDALSVKVIPVQQAYTLEATASPKFILVNDSTMSNVKPYYSLVSAGAGEVPDAPIEPNGTLMLVASEEGVRGDGVTNDSAAWNALIAKAANTGQSIYFAPGMDSVLADTITISQPNIKIYGGGTFSDNLPKGYNPPNTDATTNKTIINWTGANGYAEIGLDGRFNNSNFDRWWRGRDTGTAASKLMTIAASADGFTGQVAIRNAGGYGIQNRAINSTFTISEDSNNAYTAIETRGGSGTSVIERVEIKQHRDIKQSMQARSAIKSLIFSTEASSTAFINNVVLGDIDTDNCNILCESGLGVGTSDSTAYIKNLTFDSIKTVVRREETNTGGTTIGVSHLGKFENVGVIRGKSLIGEHTTQNGQSFWFDAATDVQIDYVEIRNWGFRVAPTMYIPKFVFKMRNSTQPLNDAIIMLRKNGINLHIGEFVYDMQGITRNYTTAEAVFNLNGRDSTNTIKIDKLTLLNATTYKPYLAKQASTDTAQIVVTSGNLGGFRAGSNARIVDSNGNPVTTSTAGDTAKVISDPNAITYPDGTLYLTNEMRNGNGEIIVTNREYDQSTGNIYAITTQNLSYRTKIIIEDNITRTAGMSIFGHHYNHDWVIRNNECFGKKGTANPEPDWGRWFVRITNPYSVLIENNYIEDHGGIKIELLQSFAGNSTQFVTIRKIKAKNIWQPDGLMNFINITGNGASVPNILLEWLECQNIPGQSAIEDTINIYNTKGRADNRAKIRNIFLDGAYHQNHLTKTDYSGGGLIFDGSFGTTADKACEYWDVEDSTAIRQANYCFGFATARNSSMRRNRAVCDRRYADGTEYVAHSSGFWADDYSGNNVATGLVFDSNTAGVISPGGVRDKEFKAYNNAIGATTFTNNRSLADPITATSEEHEQALWDQKKASNNIICGPIQK